MRVLTLTTVAGLLLLASQAVAEPQTWSVASGFVPALGRLVTTPQKPLVYNLTHLDASGEPASFRDRSRAHSRFCSGDSICLSQEP